MIESLCIKYTVRDYMSIPDGDERRFELIDGELMLAPAPVSPDTR